MKRNFKTNKNAQYSPFYEQEKIKKHLSLEKARSSFVQREEKFLLNPFREHHLYHILSTYEIKKLPMDIILRDHFKNNKAVGSKDRAFIARTAYSLIRHLNLIDYLLKGVPTWAQRVALLLSANLSLAKKDPQIPLSIRACMPLELFEKIHSQYGEEKALFIAENLNQEAPITIRVNPLKITREAFINQLRLIVDAKGTEHSPYGIVCSKRIDLFSLKEFKEGLFEVQDEGSQLVSLLVDAKEGNAVLDYCSGSGGKSLLIAARMHNRGQIYLHDIRRSALKEAKVRLKRAGIQNAQILFKEDPKLKKLKKKMDWVLVDVPCSGSGTLRRNPDMKWKIDSAMIERLVKEQRIIFENALGFLKERGHIVYATCSILEEENEKQVEYFLSTFQLELVGTPFATIPKEGEMDGFFAAVFKNLFKKRQT